MYFWVFWSFDATENGLIFLIFLEMELLVYRNTSNLYPLILYYFAEFISFSNFLVDSLGIFIYRIMFSIERKRVLFLSSLDVFYSFSWLIALARSSRTMLNSNGESSILVCSWSWWGTLRLSPLSITLAVGCS